MRSYISQKQLLLQNRSNFPNDKWLNKLSVPEFSAVQDMFPQMDAADLNVGLARSGLLANRLLNVPSDIREETLKFVEQLERGDKAGR